MRTRILLTLVLAAAAGCIHVLKPNEIAQRGTRPYPNVTQEQATEASAQAMTTLGFQVTQKDAQNGLVRTAPKAFMESAHATAVGSGNTATASAVSYEDAIAWDIKIDSSSDGVVLHAMPRAYTNGNDVTERGLPAVTS
jgi:hypothetical protein